MTTREDPVISDGRQNLGAEGSRRLQALALVLGIVIVAWAYVDALDGSFIWDDLELLKQTCIHTPCHLPEYFKLPFWESHVMGAGQLYRPLTTLSLALDKALHGENFAGFHITNIAFHLLNVGLLAKLARRLGANGFIAVAMATVWGLLPRLSESVAWISGRTDILYSTAAVLALLLWSSERRGRRLLAAGLGLVSAFSKEAGVSVLLGLGVAEWLSAPQGKRLSRALVPGLVLVGYLGLRQTVTPLTSAYAAIPLSFTGRVVTVFEALGRYTWMSVDLWHPKAQIGVVGEPRLGYVVVGLVTAVVALATVIRKRQCRDPLVILVTIVGTMPLLLVIHLIPMPWVAVVGDRLGYLSWGIGACAIAVVVTKVASRSRPATPAVMVALSALAATLVPSVQRRVQLFADELAFWVKTVSDTAESNWGPSINLSGLYLRGGLPKDSLAILDSLENRCPPAGQVTSADTEAAKALARLGDYTGAEARLLSQSPRQSSTLMLLEARLRLAQGNVAAAETLGKATLREYPEFVEAQQFLHTLERVQLLELELRGTENLLARSILEAQIPMLSGRLIEAESKWQRLLSNPEIPKSDADEAVAFECALGSASVVPAIVAQYSKRQTVEASLLRACHDKIKEADRLQATWHQVQMILARKNESAGHCRDYGLFSD